MLSVIAKHSTTMIYILSDAPGSTSLSTLGILFGGLLDAFITTELIIEDDSSKV